MAFPRFPSRPSLLAMLFGCWMIPSPAGAQPPSSDTVQPWTIASAREQLAAYPKDPYLQYVLWQLHDREGTRQLADEWLRRNSGLPPTMAGRRQDIDLMSIFSGGLAVQESLQLDTLTGESDATISASTVPISQLKGPTVRSHPWKSMLAGRTPNVSMLARSVPDDCLYIRFDSLAHLGNGLKLLDQLGSYTLQQMASDARTQALPERLQQQLAFELSPDSIVALSPHIRDLAIVSSDLFVSEGTDVSLLLELQDPDGFQTKIEASLQQLASRTPGVKRNTGTLLGTPYEQLTTPDRRIQAYSATPRPNLYVRTNSKIALERILATIRGTDAANQKVVSLGDTDEFRYIRTLMPEQSPEENGWIYMSDPFIRKMVGPKTKLTQMRRLTCYNHLRMLGHASLMHATEHGQLATSIQALQTSKCLPSDFGTRRMQCPDGGTYTLSADGTTARCSHHGSPHRMTPCCELELDSITAKEAEQYKAFLNDYNQYWRTFFDPIAIRLQMEPNKTRIETIILPLIDNSIYTSMANSFGGTPKSLQVLPTVDSTILTLGFQVHKAKLLRESGLDRLVEMADAASVQPPESELPESRWQNLQQASLAILNFESATMRLPPHASESFSKGLSWRVQILPFLGEQELYQRFHLNEPWDSPHNLKLVSEIPNCFRSHLDRLNTEGKTTVVMPRHEKAIRLDKKSRRFADITDGLSGTILLIDADPDHAVVWTSPDDLDIDLDNPRHGWTGNAFQTSAVALADGSVELLESGADDALVRALLTIDGGENTINRERTLPAEPSSTLAGPYRELSRIRIARLVSQGLGDRASLNLCDTDPLVDFNATQFLGMMMRNARGNPANMSMDWWSGEALVSMMILSLNSPVYFNMEVQDPTIVDESLDRLDEMLVALGRDQRARNFNPFFRIDQDHYRFSGSGNVPFRAYSFRFGPVKWRFFWGRIGNSLVVASKPFILEELAYQERAAQERARASGEAAPHSVDGPTAHAMIRLRPEHWRQVLQSYRLGWSENQRLGCLNNLGALASISRTLQLLHPAESASGSFEERVRDLEGKLLDSHAFCPAGGEYHYTPGSSHVECSVHGTAYLPKQPSAPDLATPLGAWLDRLSDIHMELTFLEEGLKAVATIELKP